MGYGSKTLSAGWWKKSGRWGFWQPQGGDKKHPTPYLLKSMQDPGVRAAGSALGPIVGAIGEAMAQVCPELYEVNVALGSGTRQDCCFPSAQQQGPTSHPLYAHQVILRIIGRALHGQSLDDARISLHIDESDHGTGK